MLNNTIAAPRPPILEVFDWTQEQNGMWFQRLGVPGHDGGSWTKDSDLALTITEITVHWREVFTAEGLSNQQYLGLVAGDARYHFDKNWSAAGQTPEYGDGLMYHIVIAPNGLIVQTRPFTRRTYNARGANGRNFAILIMTGPGNRATPEAIASLHALLNWLCYGCEDLPLVTPHPETVVINGRSYRTQGVLTHDESLRLQGQPTKGCCGPAYTAVVVAWRNEQPRLSQLPPSNPSSPAPARPRGPDYPIASVPTISPAVFVANLRRRNSPALVEDPSGLKYYRAIMRYGLNPAIALGFFGKESEFGTFENSPVPNKAAMRGAKNWGNIRPHPNTKLPPGGRAKRRVAAGGKYGLFRGYDTWMDSLLDWCEKMTSDDYRGKSLLGVLETYAPRSDGNDPQKYADKVNEWVAGWDAQSGEFEVPDLADDGRAAA